MTRKAKQHSPKGPLKHKAQPDLMEAVDPLKGRQCTAKSKRSGKRCLKAPILGGNVCRMHGGAAPQVIRTAKERLALLVDPAIERLAQLISQTEFPSTAMAAVNSTLDRNGFASASRHIFTGKGGGPIQVEDVTKMSYDEILQEMQDIVNAALAKKQ